MCIYLLLVTREHPCFEVRTLQSARHIVLTPSKYLLFFKSEDLTWACCRRVVLWPGNKPRIMLIMWESMGSFSLLTCTRNSETARVMCSNGETRFLLQSFFSSCLFICHSFSASLTLIFLVLLHCDNLVLYKNNNNK